MTAPLPIHNPHSILAALQMRPEEVIQVTLPLHGGGGDEAWKKIETLVHQKKIKQTVRSPRSNKNKEGGRTSAAEALILPKSSLSAEELFAGAREKRGGRGIWLALDSIQDPHNVGAIFRLAGFFGVEGILITSERSSPLTATTYDVSCGGIESVPYALQINLQRGLEIAKESGLWILGTSEHAHESYLKIERDRPWLVVLGNEEKGMRRLTEEACDVLCRIPPLGGVTSLNVSTAAGILISRLSYME